MRKSILLTLILSFGMTNFISAQQSGNASFYNQNLKGRHTSDGGKYHPDSLTCAHKTLPFGTILKVRNPKNDKEVVVVVTDRGPHQKRLMIDLSYSAAKHLGIIQQGIAVVMMTQLNAMPFIIPTLYALPIPFSKIKIQGEKIITKMNDIQTAIVQLNE